jgi:hypothetical protein
MMMTADAPTIEYRLVCAHYGTPGSADHRSHCWPKSTLAKAEQSRIDADHHAEMHPDLWYAGEAPYRVQVRSVFAWHDHALPLELEL